MIMINDGHVLPAFWISGGTQTALQIFIQIADEDAAHVVPGGWVLQTTHSIFYQHSRK